jgi:hypothetical protein
VHARHAHALDREGVKNQDLDLGFRIWGFEPYSTPAFGGMHPSRVALSELRSFHQAPPLSSAPNSCEAWVGGFRLFDWSLGVGRFHFWA